MAWTETTRASYERHSGRYASDVTDETVHGGIGADTIKEALAANKGT